MDTISVIVPIFNGQKYIRGLIRQIAACMEFLHEKRIELILSCDNPKENISIDYSTDIELKVIETKIHRGIHGARIRGLNAATGEYIVFLDQDDILFPEYMESQLSNIGESDAIVCGCIHEEKVFYDERRPIQNVICKEKIIGEFNYIVSPGQVLIRRDSIPAEWSKKVMTNNGADDWFLWILMFSQNKKIKTNETILFKHTIEPGVNASLNSWKMHQSINNLAEILKKNNYLNNEDLEKFYYATENVIKASLDDLDKHKNTNIILEKLVKKLLNKSEIINFPTEISKIAIYGMNSIAQILKRIIEEQNIRVEYYIDLNAKYLKSDIPIYSLYDSMPNVDLVIVALVLNQTEVVKDLKARNIYNIVTINELLD